MKSAWLFAGCMAAFPSGPKAQDPTAKNAAELVNLTKTCTQKLSVAYSHDDGDPSNTYICGDRLDAIYWTADMDIDCDGIQTTTCNKNTDPWFQVGTAFGNSVDASKVAYYVIPNNFNLSSRGIAGGQIAAIIYKGKVTYSVLADTGPPEIIGEASYATANILGIDPDPAVGGTDGPVTYIVFTAAGARAPITEAGHQNALTQGDALADAFIRSNGGTFVVPVPDSPGLRLTRRGFSVDAQGPHAARVFDPQGGLVLLKTGRGPAQYELPELKSGVYLVQAKTGSVTETRRLVLF